MVRTRTNPSHLSSALLPSRLFPSCQSSERSFIFIPNKYPSILVLMKTFTDFNLSKLFNKKTNKIPIYMGVSKNGGTPKWMVYNGKPYYNGMIWGYHHFRKHPHVQAIFDLWLSLTKWFPRLNSPRVEETRPHNQPAAIVSLRRSNGTRPMKLKHTKKVRLQKTKCLSLKKYLSKKYKKVKCLERSKVNMTCLLNHDFLTFFFGKKIWSQRFEGGENCLVFRLLAVEDNGARGLLLVRVLPALAETWIMTLQDMVGVVFFFSQKMKPNYRAGNGNHAWKMGIFFGDFDFLQKWNLYHLESRWRNVPCIWFIIAPYKSTSLGSG